MAEFLTTKKILGYLDDVIDKAKKQLVLVSPYIKLSPDYKVRLRNASRRGVKITVIYGKDELGVDELDFFAELKGVELFYFQFLHGKTFYNESMMIITSMNLYDFSSQNIEIGVLVNRSVDKDIYDNCINEISSLLHSSEKLKKVGHSGSHNGHKSHYDSYIGDDIEDDEYGYCIRCRQPIILDESRPYCPDCFFSWNEWRNEDYRENFCHDCGQEHSSTKAKPLCNTCYYN